MEMRARNRNRPMSDIIGVKWQLYEMRPAFEGIASQHSWAFWWSTFLCEPYIAVANPQQSFRPMSSC
jgi:hypothetical protein